MKSKVLLEAKKLYDLGFAIHWLRPKSKVPLESGWTRGERKTWEYLLGSYQDAYNVGVRLGTPSQVSGSYLAVIDIDVKSEKLHHKEEALAAAKPLLEGNHPPIVLSGRGGGSRHYYCLTKKPFKTITPFKSTEKIKVFMPSKQPSQKEIAELTPDEIKKGIRISHAWEVSLYSDGRQVVLPPSIHPDSGKQYVWKKEIEDTYQLPILDLETLSPATIQEKIAGNLESFKVEKVDIEWLPISESVRNAILKGDGVTDRSGYLMRASEALLNAGLTENEILNVLTDPKTYLGHCAYDHAKTQDRKRAAEWVYKYTLKKVSDEQKSGIDIFKMPVEAARKLSKEEIEKQNKDFEDLKDWRHELDKTAKGKARDTLKNLDKILTHLIDGKVFQEDLFASRIEYGVNTPWGGKANAAIEDKDLIKIKRFLSDTEFQIEPSTHAILEATSLLADRYQFHPVREWLESLKWDKISRVNTWIKDYCQGKAEEPYLSEVSRKFLLAMVKRIFEPGCQWDYVLVLEGKQGKYKSSAARALAGDKWFMDNLPDLKDKDSMLNLQGKWLIELGELADVKRADYNLVKAYLVRRTDTVRPHYGRLKADVPRQSVFIGTINEGQYLKDPTGNRRYWPVKVGLCDVKGLSKIREQLFAEAMHLYKTTQEILMLNPTANAQASEEQDSRRVDDDVSEMQDALLSFMNDKTIEFDFSKEFKSRDLFVGINAPWGRWNSERYSMNSAATVLRNMGFERKKSHGQRVWYRPENENLQENGSGAPLGHPSSRVPPKSGASPVPPKRGAPEGAPTKMECDFY